MTAPAQPPAAERPIEDVLADLGFRGPAAGARARAVLEEAGLTHPRKRRISEAKRARVESVLRERLALACHRAGCLRAAAATGREVLPATLRADCSVCGGSDNRTAIDRAVASLHARGVRRVVVVGGAPAVRKDLADLVGGRIELRLVSGTEQRRGKDARADLRWADVIVVWGSTELDHRVSNLYSGNRVVVCPRRGLGALAETIIAATTAPRG